MPLQCKRIQMLLLSIVVELTLNLAFVYCQDSNQIPIHQNDKALQVDFEDRFLSVQTLEKYETKGKVTIADGQLKITSGASIERSIKPTSHFEISANVTLAELEESNPKHELKLLFSVVDENDCFLSLQRELDNGKTRYTISYFEYVDQPAPQTKRLVRKLETHDWSGQLDITYRVGYVSIRSAKEALFGGFIDTGQNIKAIQLQSIHHTAAIDTFIVNSNPDKSPELRSKHFDKISEIKKIDDKMMVCYRQGKYRQAAELALTSGKETERIFGRFHSDYAASVNNAAAIYFMMGDYRKAEPLYRKSQEIWKGILGEQHPRYSTILNNLAALYRQTADYDSAEKLYLESLKIRAVTFGEMDPLYGMTLNNLGVVYRMQDRNEEAIACFQKSSNIHRITEGEYSDNYALSQSNLGSFYDQIGKPKLAIDACKNGVRIYQKLHGDLHPRSAMANNNLGAAFANSGEFGRAEIYYDKALQTYRDLNATQTNAFTRCLVNRFALCQAMDEIEKATSLIQEATKTMKSIISDASPIQSERQQFGILRNNRFMLHEFISHHLQFGCFSAEEVAETVWDWKGIVFSRQSAYRSVSQDPELHETFIDYQKTSSQVSKLMSSFPIPSKQADGKSKWLEAKSAWKKQLDALVSKRETIQQKVAELSKEFAQATSSIATNDVQDWLPPKCAYVDFLHFRLSTPTSTSVRNFNFEDHYLAIIVARDKQTKIIDLGNSKKIDELVSNFRNRFSVSDDGQSLERQQLVADELRLRLWKPLEVNLAGFEAVVLSTHSSLNMLPFNALPGKNPGSFLIDDYQISFVPSVRFLVNLNNKPAAQTENSGGMLMVGDIDYGGTGTETNSAKSNLTPIEKDFVESASGTWSQLPGFEKELNQISKLFRSQFDSEPVLLRGAAASKQEFIDQANNFETIHLITHGYFADPNRKSVRQVTQASNNRSNHHVTPSLGTEVNRFMPGLLSGLVMSGANSNDIRTRVNGILRASEVEATLLNNVDLVVMSACETGLGPVAGGEAIAGLQRSFQIAGADTVIASLWKVDDRATQTLMVKFYENLWQHKMSKPEALRMAQLAMLKRYDAKTGELRGLGDKTVKLKTKSNRLHPRFWAAFQLSGDWW